MTATFVMEPPVPEECLSVQLLPGYTLYTHTVKFPTHNGEVGFPLARLPVDTSEPGTNVRGRRTRAALLAATREVLEEGGFEELTMTAVAERAGVTRRAIYLHFR